VASTNPRRASSPIMQTGLFGPNAVQSFHLAGGDAGTSRTIAEIRKLVAAGKRDIEINRLAIGIVWPTPQFSETEKAEAIFNWVQQNTRFITMIVNAQTLRTPREILKVGAGDCSNLNAVLIPSMLETIGIPARLVTVAGDAEAPNEFTHVYAEAYVDKQWIPMDVARPDAEFGRAPEQYFRKRIWDLESPQYRDVRGLSGMLGITPRARGGRGLGDDLTTILGDIPGIESGTSQIISASRAAPTNIFASSVPGGSATTGATGLPATAAIGSTTVVNGVTYTYTASGWQAGSGLLAGVSSSTLLLLGLAAVALILMER
jgi:hypothetical protein